MSLVLDPFLHCALPYLIVLDDQNLIDGDGKELKWCCENIANARKKAT